MMTFDFEVRSAEQELTEKKINRKKDTATATTTITP